MGGKEEIIERPTHHRSLKTGADLEERTLAFAVQITSFVADLPRNESSRIFGRQLLRSGTSIGASYREANRAESPEDFAHKVAISVKEAAETEYWLLLCQRTAQGPEAKISELLNEASQLIAILSTILRRTRAKIR